LDRRLAWVLTVAGVVIAAGAGTYLAAVGEWEVALAVMGFVLGLVGYVLGAGGLFIAIGQVQSAKERFSLLAEMTLIQIYMLKGFAEREGEGIQEVRFDELFDAARKLAGDEKALAALVSRIE
jgi:hypothetical protein